MKVARTLSFMQATQSFVDSCAAAAVVVSVYSPPCRQRKASKVENVNGRKGLMNGMIEGGNTKRK